jgi:hypothetical protein
MYQTDVVQFTDSLISLIQEENYNQAYKLTDESYVDNEMTLDEFVQYFQAIKHYYGRILDFKIELRSITFNDKTDNTIRAFGEIVFENANGYLYWILKKHDNDQIKLDYFDLMINDYSQIESLNDLAKKELEFIKLEDFDGLYNSTKMYKQFTSIDKYHEEIEKIFNDEFVEYKLKRHDIRVSNNRTCINLNYEINNRGDVIMLEFIDNKDSSYLYDLQFFINDESKKENSKEFKTSTYKNKKYDFRCEYPSDWEIKNINGYTVIFNEPGQEDDIFNTTFDIQTIESTNIEKFCKNYEKILTDSPTFKDFKIISKSEIEFKGLYAIEYQCSARILDFILIKWKSIVFVNDKNIFKLSTTSMIGKDFLNKNKTEKIYNTFEFK